MIQIEEALKELLEAVEDAIQAGDWTVDGACDPDLVIKRSKKALAQRTWVGLTDDEKNDCLVSADPCEALAEPEARQLIEDVEQALKVKNT